MKEVDVLTNSKLGYTIDELTKVLPLGKTSIYSLIRSGRLPSLLISGRRIITDVAIRKFLEEAHASSNSPNDEQSADSLSTQSSLQ